MKTFIIPVLTIFLLCLSGYSHGTSSGGVCLLGGSGCEVDGLQVFTGQGSNCGSTIGDPWVELRDNCAIPVCCLNWSVSDEGSFVISSGWFGAEIYFIYEVTWNGLVHQTFHQDEYVECDGIIGPC